MSIRSSLQASLLRTLRKPQTISLVACLLGMCLLSPNTAWTGGKDRYANGKIDVWMVEVEGYEAPRAMVKAMIDAPPEKVWPLIDKCEDYEKTMLRTESAKLIKNQGGYKYCEIEIDMPFPLDNLTSVTKAKHVAGPKKWSRKWTLVSGDYTVNEGSWVLTPFDEAGTKTMVHYQIIAEPKTSIPDWVREKAQKSALPKMIEHLRSQVE